MGKQMLEFNDCVSGVFGDAAAKSLSSASSELLSDENVDAATAEIKEFRDSPDRDAVSHVVLPVVMEGEALDQLLNAVEELRGAMTSSRVYLHGLHQYTVTRPSALLPDKVMWLCEHHKALLEQWDKHEINESQLLDRVENPKAAAAASAAASSLSPIASQPASFPAPSNTQPLVFSPDSTTMNRSSNIQFPIHQLPAASVSSSSVQLRRAPFFLLTNFRHRKTLCVLYLLATMKAARRRSDAAPCCDTALSSSVLRADVGMYAVARIDLCCANVHVQEIVKKKMRSYKNINKIKI